MKARKLFDGLMKRQVLPPDMDEEVLLDWLNEVEGQILAEVYLVALTDIHPYETVPEEELAVPYPYDRLYKSWMLAQVSKSLREWEDYENLREQYNREYQDFVRHVQRVIRPGYGRAGEEGYYLSAYGIAVRHGYRGTEEEWLESLRGAIPQLIIGTVETGEPGTAAEVTITGTTAAPELNFVLPRGLPGPSGREGTRVTLAQTGEPNRYTASKTSSEIFTLYNANIPVTVAMSPGATEEGLFQFVAARTGYVTFARTFPDPFKAGVWATEFINIGPTNEAVLSKANDALNVVSVTSSIPYGGPYTCDQTGAQIKAALTAGRLPVLFYRLTDTAVPYPFYGMDQDGGAEFRKVSHGAQKTSIEKFTVASGSGDTMYTQETIPAGWVTEKVDEAIPEIMDEASLRTWLYERRKDPVRVRQFEISQGGVHENLVTALGGRPAGQREQDKAFLYIILPFSEAGGFTIHAIWEGRTNGALFEQWQMGTLNANWKSTGWVETAGLKRPEHTTMTVNVTNEGGGGLGAEKNFSERRNQVNGSGVVLLRYDDEVTGASELYLILKTDNAEQKAQFRRVWIENGVTKQRDAFVDYAGNVTVVDTEAGGGSIPQATEDTLGGVKADPAQAEDTQPVRIGADGKLATKPGGGGGEKPWTLIGEQTADAATLVISFTSFSCSELRLFISTLGRRSDVNKKLTIETSILEMQGLGDNNVLNEFFQNGPMTAMLTIGPKMPNTLDIYGARWSGSCRVEMLRPGFPQISTAGIPWGTQIGTLVGRSAEKLTQITVSIGAAPQQGWAVRLEGR